MTFNLYIKMKGDKPKDLFCIAFTAIILLCVLALTCLPIYFVMNNNQNPICEDDEGTSAECDTEYVQDYEETEVTVAEEKLPLQAYEYEDTPVEGCDCEQVEQRKFENPYHKIELDELLEFQLDVKFRGIDDNQEVWIVFFSEDNSLFLVNIGLYNETRVFIYNLTTFEFAVTGNTNIDNCGKTSGEWKPFKIIFSRFYGQIKVISSQSETTVLKWEMDEEIASKVRFYKFEESQSLKKFQVARNCSTYEHQAGLNLREVNACPGDDADDNKPKQFFCRSPAAAQKLTV